MLRQHLFRHPGDELLQLPKAKRSTFQVKDDQWLPLAANNVRCQIDRTKELLHDECPRIAPKFQKSNYAPERYYENRTQNGSAGVLAGCRAGVSPSSSSVVDFRNDRVDPLAEFTSGSTYVTANSLRLANPPLVIAD